MSQHAKAQVDKGRRYDGFDPDVLLIELPVAWLADGFTKGYDPSRFSAERHRAWSADLPEGYWDSDDLNGRPRGEGIRVAATISYYFYEEWRGENLKRGISDYGYRGEMKDYAAEVIVKDYFAWRFRVGVRPVFVWEVGWPKDVESLIDKVRELMDKPKKRREPGVGEELAFPMSLNFPPKHTENR